MLVVLNGTSGPIAVQTGRIRAVIPNADDTACTISFSSTHQIEVLGSLAKVRGKLDQRATTPRVQDVAPDETGEASGRALPRQRTRTTR